MKYYKIIYKDGKEIITEGKNSLDIVKKYDLTNSKNISTKIIEVNPKLKGLSPFFNTF